MHETLRSSFKLQKQNAEWQRITSDIANNTFFSIYAKFAYDNDSFTPTSCEVKIQNYRGSVTYGISEIDPELKFIFDKTEGIRDYVFLLTIKLRPLHVCVEKTSSPLTVKHYNNDQLKKINKLPNEFSNDHLLFVNLEYEDFHGGIDPEANDANVLQFIDENYYVRDGDRIRTRRYLDKPYNSQLNKDAESLFEIELFDPHTQVVTSEVSTISKEIISSIVSRPCRDTYVRFF